MSLTYEDIIDGFGQACDLHYQVNEWSTSPLLSDLEVGTKGNQDPAVFPYVFLQPTGGQLAQGKMVYSFNMIVMDRVKPDMYKETNTISDMIQIGQDLSHGGIGVYHVPMQISCYPYRFYRLLSALIHPYLVQPFNYKSRHHLS